jgi:threonine/homoserine/homoserine lactone efflux protein
MDPQVLTFAGLAALLTITPGADMALVTKNARAAGRKAAVLTTLGINIGLLSWATASAVGLAAILSASATAFTILKLVGGAYLILLGLQTIWQTRRGEEPRIEEVRADRPGQRAARGSAFRQGLLTNLLNPKIAVFYTTLLPQFISPRDPVFLKSMLLAAIHNLLGCVWLTGYAYFVVKTGDLLRCPTVKRILDRATGAVLITLGLRLAFEER